MIPTHVKIDSQLNVFNAHSLFILKWLVDHEFVFSNGGLCIRTGSHQNIKNVLRELNFISIEQLSQPSTDVLIHDDIVVVVDDIGCQLCLYSKDGANITTIFEKIKPFINSANINETRIDYLYLKANSVQIANIYLSMTDNVPTIYNELYPSIDINALATEFTNSKERLLILYGEPGVGKTTFIKHLLYSQKYEGVAYAKDKNLIVNSEFWSRLHDDKYNLIIFDDLDDALQPREENDKADFVNNLLSYTDGVLNAGSKVIITTNQEISNIDRALLRPGRCFDFLILDPLSYDEARQIWSETLKLDTELFDARFKDEELITQALFMSEATNVQSQARRRTYLKNGQQYLTVAQKMTQLGIGDGHASARFKRSGHQRRS